MTLKASMFSSHGLFKGFECKPMAFGEQETFEVGHGVGRNAFQAVAGEMFLMWEDCR